MKAAWSDAIPASAPMWACEDGRDPQNLWISPVSSKPDCSGKFLYK